MKTTPATSSSRRTARWSRWSPQEADTTDYGLMDTGERIQRKDLQQEMRESYLAYALP